VARKCRMSLERLLPRTCDRFISSHTHRWLCFARHYASIESKVCRKLSVNCSDLGRGVVRKIGHFCEFGTIPEPAKTEHNFERKSACCTCFAGTRGKVEKTMRFLTYNHSLCPMSSLLEKLPFCHISFRLDYESDPSCDLDRRENGLEARNEKNC
jgi:hypothetical protein